MIKDIMKLCRIQAAPLNIFILLAGYGVTSGTILDINSLQLSIIAVSGHIAFYSMNEYADVEWDTRAGKSEKPLVNGSVTENEALFVMGMSMGFCVGYSFHVLMGAPFFWFSSAMVFAGVYNLKSKTGIMSPFYLGAYGFLMFYTGLIFGMQETGTYIF